MTHRTKFFIFDQMWDRRGKLHQEDRYPDPDKLLEIWRGHRVLFEETFKNEVRKRGNSKKTGQKLQNRYLPLGGLSGVLTGVVTTLISIINAKAA